IAMRLMLLTCSSHIRPVADLAFSATVPGQPYEYFEISACKDGKPMLCQGDTGDWIGTILGHKDAVWMWDAIPGDELMTLAHKHIIKTMDFMGQDKLFCIYDLNKPEAEPEEISDHSSETKKALWCSEDKKILSSDDKTVRLWDHVTMTEVKSLNFIMLASSMEYIPEGETLVITYVSLEPIKSFQAPATINSESLHLEKEFLVAGGEDYNDNSGEELESYKGHSGPIHCVRFDPDGELYASGSEGGTLRLANCGRKNIGPLEISGELAKPKIGFPETREELEETASENSDSIYSSTPRVKA
uniref:Serine-threonine kinase receptor-associated protein n=1 Tax=Nomascus leucogenys TaxID=61853 RepID=A0A2I3GJ06_NOMLE